MPPRVFVMTSDEYLWAIKPFSYLLTRYWNPPPQVVLGCFNRPPYVLPKNFKVHSIDKENYPKDRWSDALIKMLEDYPDDKHFVFLLEDYWLVREVDIEGINSLYGFMVENPRVLRVDLTTDRLYNGKARDVGYWGHYDMIETPADSSYQMSLQAGIWSRRLMLKMLEPGKSAWETEIHLHPPNNMRVLGTRQYPLRYANAVRKGKIDMEQLGMIPKEHYHAIMEMIPKEVMYAE